MASSLEALKQPSLLALRLRVFPRPYLRLSWASKVVSTLAIHSGQGLASTRAPSCLFCRRTELGNGAGSFPSVLQIHHRRCQPQEMLTAVKQGQIYDRSDELSDRRRTLPRPDTKGNSEAEQHTGAKAEEPPEVSDLDKMLLV